MRTILEPQSLAGTGLQELMREMLVRLGEDPERDGLRDTPERMERSMEYLTKGYQENPEEILLGAMFDVAYDEMVIVKDIEMFSLCEHHLLPFFGKVHVAYIPRGKVSRSSLRESLRCCSRCRTNPSAATIDCKRGTGLSMTRLLFRCPALLTRSCRFHHARSTTSSATRATKLL